MAADIAYFRELLPSFSAVGDSNIQSYLDIAAADVGDDFGTNADPATVYLAAHLLSIAGIGPTAQAGQLAGFTNIKVGSLSLTRSERAAMGDYAASQYGVLYWRLRMKALPGAAMMVTGTGTLIRSDPLSAIYGEE